MADQARDWTDDQLEALTKRYEAIYSQAEREMREKLAKSLDAYAKENTQRRKAMDDTQEAHEEYEAWKRSQASNQAWMRGMVDSLSESAANANRLATDMLNDSLPHIYAENANMAAFALDGQLGYDTGFTLVNEDAVRYLMGLEDQETGYDQLIREVTWNPDPERSHVQDVRKREMDYPKDMRWNRQKFNVAITQGILQGESIPDIVKRTKDIYGRNKAAAVRAARTATTNAENAGRMNSFERAQALGIDMEIEWLATLDGRTRDAHRALDGERIQLGEKFSNGLRWPADPLGEPSETWNCRCRANGRVVGFDGKRGDWVDERGDRWTRLPKGMTYEEWRKAKPVSRAESYANEAGRVSAEWQGLPRVLGGDMVVSQMSTVVASAPFDEAVLTDKLETYVGGGYDLDDLMTQEEFEWMREHEHTYEKALYRIEDRRFTAAQIDDQIAAGVEDVEVDFNATYRSFTQGGRKTLGELLEQSIEYADPEDFVIFRTVGDVKGFDMAKYAENYMDDQKEVLVGGEFEFWGDDMMEIMGHTFRVLNVRQVGR